MQIFSLQTYHFYYTYFQKISFSFNCHLFHIANLPSFWIAHVKPDATELRKNSFYVLQAKLKSWATDKIFIAFWNTLFLRWYISIIYQKKAYSLQFLVIEANSHVIAKLRSKSVSVLGKIYTLFSQFLSQQTYYIYYIFC